MSGDRAIIVLPTYDERENVADLLAAVREMLAADKAAFSANSLYGGGRASEVIVEKLLPPR